MVVRKIFRNKAAVGGALILLALAGCSVIGPEQVRNSAGTGSVAPRLLFKQHRVQAGIFIWSSDTAFISSIHITIVPSLGGSPVSDTFSFTDHHATLSNIPSGLAGIYVSAHTRTGDTILTGADTFTVLAGQTVTPQVDVSTEVVATKPIGLTLTQVNDSRVDLTWRPTGYAASYMILGEWYDTVGAAWKTFDSSRIYGSSDYQYNRTTDQLTYADSNVPVMPGADIRFSLRAIDYYDVIGPSSAPAGITLRTGGQPVYYAYDAYVYGVRGVPGLYKLWLKIYKAGAGSPPEASLPAGQPVKTWTFSDTPSVNIYYKTDSLEQGDYWIYAYNTMDGTDNWTGAFKRKVTVLSHTSDTPPADVITLDFSSALFSNNGTVKGALTGVTTSTDYYADLYYYNWTDNYSYFMGYYYCGNGSPGYVRIQGLPTLSEMAAFNQSTYSIGNDTYFLEFWNDADANNRLGTGDMFYWDSSKGISYLDFGDVTDTLDIGTLSLDSAVH